MRLGSGAFEGQYSFASRFEEGTGTNPEELIGAAHAGCFTMFLSGQLSKLGKPPKSIQTTATVHLGDGAITKIELDVTAVVPGIEDAAFQDKVVVSKDNCPLSKALASVPEISVRAKLQAS
jgi:osmotically inducible protein OsmC